MEDKLTWLDRMLQNRVLTHVLFWLAVLFAAPLFAELNDQPAFESFIYRAVGLPLKIVATYGLVYYLIPRFFHTKRYVVFFLSLFVSAYVLCVLYRINNVYIAETLAGAPDFKEPILDIITAPFPVVFFYLTRVYAFSILFLFLKMIKDRAEEKRQIEILQKEKTTAELNFLKAQIHPHFLFNTLNNLYTLTLTKSDDAPEVVIKLSEMLDYMLYQCQEPTVRLSKEIELIQNYIDLELLRYGDRLDLVFEHQVNDLHAKIAPLVLLSIVENSFKHGVSGDILQPKIEIRLEEVDEQLNFRVFNTKSSLVQHDDNEYRKGIGVKNIRRQLDIHYPSQHTWHVEEAPHTFEVNLSINL